MAIANMRESYHAGQLPWAAVRGRHPLVVFADSISQADSLHARVEGAHPSLLAPAKRLILGTVDQATGRPAATPVRIASCSAAEIVVGVDATSPALRHLEVNPLAALLFHSQGTQRQLRVEGKARVAKTEGSEAGAPERGQKLTLPGDTQGRAARWSAEEVEASLFEVAKAYREAKVPGLAALDPNAMCVVTARQREPGGLFRPSARMVLLKGCEEAGPVFYTNFRSPKGRDLEANPQAAFALDWPTLGLRLDVAGPVQKVSDGTADAYWRTRPYASQLGSAASRQSEPLSWRGDLIARALLYGLLHGPWPPRPKHWGGLLMDPDRVQWKRTQDDPSDGAQVRVVIDPTQVEAWQGRDSRLHDRWLWLRDDDGSWSRPERLSP
ncbi:MAG: pyridoxal 5'-phosphate synthase [Proteobacteria bacterium]|nr:pyridoxal 5'-phosphate synthase [Pseudomonadota bacterium]